MKKSTSPKNYVKGFDRIAILLAIPIAIFVAPLASKLYAKANSFNIFDMKGRFAHDEITKTRFISNNKGVIADGEEELQQWCLENPQAKSAIITTIAVGGDPNGTLVDVAKFGFYSEAVQEFWAEYCGYSPSLIPSKFKRYAVAILGAIASALATVLSIGLSTRFVPKTIRWLRGWIRNGFAAPRRFEPRQPRARATERDRSNR